MEVGRGGEDVALREDQGQPGPATQPRRLQDALLHGGVRGREERPDVQRSMEVYLR